MAEYKIFLYYRMTAWKKGAFMINRERIMHFFEKAECSDDQMLAFWAWFEKNEGKLTDMEGEKRSKILREARKQIQSLFPSCPNGVTLTVMPDGRLWEMIITHGGHASARKTACRIRVLMPASLQGKWRMEVAR